MTTPTETTMIEKPPIDEKSPSTLAPTTSVDAPIPTGTYLDEPPAYDFHDINATDRKELVADARSLNSSTSDTKTVVATGDFQPTRTLLIGARGIRFVRLPMPSGQLEIPILDTEGKLVYTSTRAKKSSGNALLTNANGAQLLASEYNFGPGKEPKIRVLDRNAPPVVDEKTGMAGSTGEEIVTKGKWTSRRQDFFLPNGQGNFTWRYTRERDAFNSAAKGKDKKRTHLVLEVSSPNASSDAKDSKKKEVSVKRVAELVRHDEARTPGTSSSDAGNGGQLQIDAAFCESIGLREDVIVASCLMMLKKEIDRRRVVQAMIIAGMAS